MAAIVDRSGAVPTPEPPAEPGPSREAVRLLEMFTAAAPATPDAFVPGVGMPGGADVPKPHGLYTNALIGPDVWPSESEQDLRSTAADLKHLAQQHDSASSHAKAMADNVFTVAWTSGTAATAAADHYRKEDTQHLRLADAFRFVGSAYERLAGNVGSIKRNMRDAHDGAHREIEELLRANMGQAVGVGPILTRYRTLIAEYSTELRTFVADEVTMLGNEFPLTPPGTEGTGDGKDDSRDGWTDEPRPSDPVGETPGDARDPITPTPGEPGQQGEVPAADGGTRAPWTPVAAPPTKAPPGTGIPQMPQLPSAPSLGGSGGSPLSGAASGGMGPLSGLLSGGSPLGNAGGLAQSAAGAGNSAGAPNQAFSRAMSSALSGEFGRGVAAGVGGAASGLGPMAAQQPIPQPPSTPLGPPAGSTPVSAAPAAAPTPLAAPGGGASAGVPAAPAAGGPAGGGAPMTPYGSVLPPAPAGMGGAGAPASPSLSSPPPQVAPTPGNPGVPPTGFVPAVRDSGPARIGRDVSMTDLESARVAVADLAAASRVVYPGLQWAVVVSRGASGMPELWVSSNEGASYIPVGVYLPRAMPLAAGLDLDFDARWFGWSNPAETALRAMQARGDAISAIATTWPHDSELVTEAVQDVAIGVAPAGDPADAGASTLTRGRSHRLETIDPALYHQLAIADPPQRDAYARQVTQDVAFGSGPELSATAQSVARALISARWPSEAEWTALRTEYDSARLMAGSQHPGLIGIEEPAQLLNYQSDFTLCRRIETLLCWDDGTAGDVVYAARAAGVVLAWDESRFAET